MSQNNGPESVAAEKPPAEAADSLPDPVQEAVQAIAAMHARAERHVDRPQRIIERVSATIGRPAALYIVVLIVVVWIVINLDMETNGIPPWDVPPFFWMQGLITFAALTTTIVVLITQRRQDVTDERRAQLDLQISLVIEQKTTKLISLLEELRRDLPNVHNRTDLEAERMTEAADPQVMLIALEHVISEKVAETEGLDRANEERVLTDEADEEKEADEAEPKTTV